MGRIDGCTNPESAELTIDDETFVFGNCALTMGIPGYRGGNGIVYLQGNAFISRARIDPSGSIELVERQLVTGLTATLGIDILRKATRRFPTGTAFVAEGGRPICHPASRELLTNVDLIRPRALAFDPETGEVRGEIPLWDGSAIANRFNALDQPNGLAVDAKGNLYVGDIPNSNPVDTLPPPVDSAVYRIPHDALDALAARDDESAARNVARIEVPGFVNGVTSSPVDDSIWIVSCSEHDPVRGGIYQLSERDFDRGTLP
ncbi:MAG TPA: hypothetical protein ENI85_02755, partial [Deltaproteobacteria bacterium]|nr:hypothetical protein [Deltaproteobacteria bacterium]